VEGDGHAREPVGTVCMWEIVPGQASYTVGRDDVGGRLRPDRRGAGCGEEGKGGRRPAAASSATSCIAPQGEGKRRPPASRSQQPSIVRCAAGRGEEASLGRGTANGHAPGTGVDGDKVDEGN
jgi:hypothetical protein